MNDRTIANYMLGAFVLIIVAMLANKVMDIAARRVAGVMTDEQAAAFAAKCRQVHGTPIIHYGQTDDLIGKPLFVYCEGNLRPANAPADGTPQ